MRITRSTLRRIIAEESARILAESKKNPHERVPGGHQMRMAAGFEDEPEEEDWEDTDKTDEEWAEEQLQGVMDMYGHPDPYGDEEAEEMGYEYDGAGGWKKPGLDEGEGKKRHQSPRDRLAAYLERVGADVDAVMAAVDDAVSRGNEEGAEVSSEDVTFNLSDEVLDAIPEDDSDRWHNMLDAVLADEVDLDAFADAEADRQDVEDTQRDLSHPSRFLEEGEEELDEGDHSYSDPGDDAAYAARLQSDLGAFTTPENIPGTYAHKQKHGSPAASHGGGGGYVSRRSEWGDPDLFGGPPRVDEGDDSNWDDDLRAQSEYQHALDVGPEVAYADYDTGGRNAFTQRGFKGRGPAPRISGDDFDSGEDEPGGDEHVMSDYEHAWNIGGGSDEEGFAADYDTGGPNKFTKMGMRGRGGLSEARWAKLAGILKG